MKILTALFVIAFVSGCATASGTANGPNGRPIWSIDGYNAEVVYNKASEKCPAGYSIIGSPSFNEVHNYVITVECK